MSRERGRAQSRPKLVCVLGLSSILTTHQLSLWHWAGGRGRGGTAQVEGGSTEPELGAWTGKVWPSIRHADMGSVAPSGASLGPQAATSVCWASRLLPCLLE